MLINIPYMEHMGRIKVKILNKFAESNIEFTWPYIAMIYYQLIKIAVKYSQVIFSLISAIIIRIVLME